MMKIFKKNELLISIFLIIIYIFSNSYFNQKYELTEHNIIFLNIIILSVIITFIKKNKLEEYYGLIRISKYKEFLYYIPLLIMILTNCLGGISLNNYLPKEYLIFIINMFLIGFLEEIIFRGFLYKSLEKDNIKEATIITSLTFGIGHIINLLLGASIIQTILQVIYSISIGFLLIIIFQKGKSLWPCIIFHGIFNSLSIFNKENIITIYIVPILLIIIPILYIKYLKKQSNTI